MNIILVAGFLLLILSLAITWIVTNYHKSNGSTYYRRKSFDFKTEDGKAILPDEICPKCGQLTSLHKRARS